MPSRLSRTRGFRMPWALAIALAASLSVAALGQSTVPPQLAATIEQVEPVVVPQGNGAPVITDGVFSSGEWEDVLRVALSDTVDLYLKEYGGVVFLGVRNAADRGSPSHAVWPHAASRSSRSSGPRPIRLTGSSSRCGHRSSPASGG